MERPSSPGQLPVHYSPRTPSFRVHSFNELVGLDHPETMALVAIGEHPASLPVPVARSFVLGSPAMAARQLYEVLHDCDAMDVRAILVVMPPDGPEWLAVRDRLLRATVPLSGPASAGVAERVARATGNRVDGSPSRPV